ncbi:uncharacterized protein FFB20_11240 [Fusarium fujikuroi]|nr:uncharacterized protein FFB20_11240 [Fusarium fujikuroi]
MALAVSNLMELCYGTRSFPQSIDLPGAWQGNQFSDESEYVYHLNSSEIDEQAESDLVGLELDGDLICRQNFPLPTVGRKLDLMRLNVYEGKGFGLVRGLNPLNYSTEDLTMMYLGIQSYIANRRGRQDKKGNMLVHIVADNSSSISNQHHRHSTSEITFHNEESGDIDMRFALSQLGIRWAAIIQLYIVTTSGRYSLRPIINFERVVPYTSPGFVILLELRNLMISFEDGREQLVHLHRTDRTFPDHVDPSGKSYIENLLMAPARSPVEREYRYKLLEVFMGEFGITRGTETSTFLSQCAHWIGEAPHLELLEILLGLGFNAAEINIHDWPEHCSPDWFAPDIAEDPFFIEYLQLLWFAEMSPLHEAILFDSVESVGKWVSRCEKDERNALGQTTLHLAISKPDYLRILINAKCDLDARDNYGITPLMYAAATNQEEAVMMLIEADSDLNATDFNWNRNFIHYAGLRQHWNLILKILNTIENHLNTDTAEKWAKFATFLFLVIFPDRLENSGVSLNQLLAKCGTVNFLYDARNDKRNRCLLHDIRSPAELEALLANGFTLVNHVDSAGQSPVMAAADRCDSVLVDRLLAYGADINRKDNFQRTSLWEMGMTHVCCQREQSYFSRHVSRKAIPNKKIDQILDGESSFIKDLESEMDRSSRKEYSALLDEWILQIKTSLDAACIKAAKQETGYSVVRDERLHEGELVPEKALVALSTFMCSEYIIYRRNFRYTKPTSVERARPS